MNSLPQNTRLTLSPGTIFSTPDGNFTLIRTAEVILVNDSLSTPHKPFTLDATSLNTISLPGGFDFSCLDRTD